MRRMIIPYFPAGVRYSTPVLFGCAIYLLILGHAIWAGTLVLLASIILTTKYVTEINLNENRYRDYLSLLTIPLNEETNSFKVVEKIVIVKERHSHMINTRSTSRQLDWQSFTATLILDGNKKLDLLTRNSKRELIHGLKEFIDFLKVDVEDHTTSEPFKVNV